MDDYHVQIVAPGDRFSALARQVCIESFRNSDAVDIVRAGGGMRAMDGFVWSRQVLKAMMEGDFYEVAQSDGAGGKPQFFTLANTALAFRQLPWEVITMNADDLACRGGLPVLILSSNIDVKGVTDENWPLCKALLQGFGDALKESNLILMTGETAVMPHCITAFCDNGSKEQLIMTWGATCHGLASRQKRVNGATIQSGMTVVGFRDEGYRCNGGTKLTNIILSTWGPEIDKVMTNPNARAFVEKVVVPSRSYAKTIARLNGWQLDGTLGARLATLHGVAHITGGGVWSKFRELLPLGVGADLDSMPAPPDVLQEAQALSMETGNPLSDYQCYGTFHGGCGLLLICEESDVEYVLREARRDGHDPQVVGRTFESSTQEVRVISQFSEKGAPLSSHNPN